MFYIVNFKDISNVFPILFKDLNNVFPYPVYGFL